MKTRHLLSILGLLALVSACQPAQTEPTKTCDTLDCPQACKNNQCIEFECSDAQLSNCEDTETCEAGVCVPLGPTGCTKRCDRGTCDKANDKCVDDICTRETEGTRCLEGNICLGSTCIPEKNLCRELNCANTRGVCDDKKRECVNIADGDCTSSKQCKEGYFCDTATRNCTLNNCRADGTCGRGVCSQLTGNCENAPDGECLTSEMCKDGYECLANGNCVKTQDLCGPNCKPGESKKRCDYDATARSATCVTTTCDSAKDCNPGEVCDVTANPTTCVAAPECAPSGDSATQVVTGDVNLSDEDLCNEKIDTYEYTPPTDGIIVVKLTRPAGEVGFGAFEVTISDPDENIIKTGTTDDGGTPAQQMMLEAEIKNRLSAPWKILVAAKDLTGTGTAKPMASYDIEITTLPEGAKKVCDNVHPIKFGGPMAGNTAITGGSDLSSPGCVMSGDAGDEVWSFHLDEESYVSFEATPNPGLRVMLSVRKDCLDDASEVSGFCSNRNVTGKAEMLAGILPAGDYFLVVSGTFDNTTTADRAIYNLTASKKPKICEPTLPKNECAPGLKAEMVCNTTGTDWIESTCPEGSNGCDANTGRCFPLPGDICSTAYDVTVDTPVHKEIDRNNYTNVYDDDATCSTSTGSGIKTVRPSKTKGTELVYKATIPPGKTLFADAQTEDYTSASIYVVEACDDLKTCLASADEDNSKATASVHYRHPSSDPAAPAIDVYVIIDSALPVTDKYNSTNKLKVNVWIGDWMCEPHSYACTKDDTVSIRCNATGSGYIDGSEVICTAGCGTGRAGRCNAPRGNACDYVKEVTPTDPATTQSLAEFTHTSKVPGKTCGTISALNGRNSNDRGDGFYSVTTDKPGQIISITVTPTDPTVANAFDPMIWLIESCHDGVAEGCLDGANASNDTGKAETLSVEAKNAGTYIFAVATAAGYNTKPPIEGTYDVSVKISTPSVEPNIFVGCDKTNNNILLYSDAFGVVQEYTCPNGCDSTTNRCSDGTGDTCQEVIVIPRDELLRTVADPTKVYEKEGTYGDTDGYSVTFDGITNQCIIPFVSSNKSTGGESFLQVELKEGELLVVKPVPPTNTSDRSSDEIFEITEKCGIADTCLVYMDTDERVGEKTLEYYASEDKTVYITVDHASSSYSLSSKKWKFEAYIEQGKACVPFSKVCASDTEVAICGDGSATPVEYTCTHGCAAGTCQVDPDETKTCATAPTVESGAPYYIDIAKGTKGINVSCLAKGKGYAQFVKVVANPDDVIHAEVQNATGNTRPSIFIAKDDCNNLDAACVAAADAPNSKYGQTNSVFSVDYLVPSDVANNTSYIIGVDTQSASFYGATGQFILTATVSPKECDPETYTPRCSTTKPDDIIVCVEGVEQPHTCSSGTCNSTTGACDLPDGNTCFEVEPLDTNDKGDEKQTSPTDWSKLTNELQPQITPESACIFSSSENDTAGKDRIFSIELAAGDTLEAWLSDFNSQDILYMTDKCEAKPLCLTGVPSSNTSESGGKKLTFYAQNGGTYFLVLDQVRRYSGFSGNAVVHYKITPNTSPCILNSRACTSDTTLEACTDAGTFETYTCPSNGLMTQTCNNGNCVIPHVSDQCYAAPTLTENFYGIFDNSSNGRFTNAHDKAHGACGFSNNGTGRDVFFRVDLKKGQKVTVTVERSQSTYKNMIYFFKDCNEINKTCFGGAVTESSDFPSIATYGYGAAEDETIYIGIDNSNSSNGSRSVVSVEFSTTDCTYGDTADTCDGDEVIYCQPNSFLAAYKCDGTCSAGKCDTPRGDSCRDPYLLGFKTDPSTGVAKVQETVHFTGSTKNNVQLGTGNACTGVKTPGKDAIYEVKLEAGQTLTATASSANSPQDDIALYLISSCEDVNNSCLAGSDKQPDPSSNDPQESLSYSAKTAQIVYLVVDSYHENLSGDVTIDVSIGTP